MSSRNQSLTGPQLSELAGAVLRNANDLLNDARVLLNEERWQRAYALAVLAAEEIGKFQLCVVAGAYDASDEQAWVGFWRNFRSHGQKFTHWVGQFIDSLDWELTLEAHAEWEEAWRSRRKAAAAVLDEKMAALYVDFKAGRVRSPSDLVGEESAKAVYEMVARVADSVTATFSGDLEVLFGSHAQTLARTVRDTLADPPPEIRDLLTRIHEAGSQEERDSAYVAAYDYFTGWLGQAAQSALGN